MLGRHPTTVSRWLSRYRKGGIEALLTIKSSPGRPTSIPPEAIAKLKEELSSPEGFSSYGEIQTWLETVCDLKISYKVVHDTVRYRLKAKLKVPRPVNIKQQEGAITDFKKKLGQQIIFHLEQHQNKIGIYEQIVTVHSPLKSYRVHTSQSKLSKRREKACKKRWRTQF